jgi:hypothetical protein
MTARVIGIVVVVVVVVTAVVLFVGDVVDIVGRRPIGSLARWTRLRLRLWPRHLVELAPRLPLALLPHLRLRTRARLARFGLSPTYARSNSLLRRLEKESRPQLAETSTAAPSRLARFSLRRHGQITRPLHSRGRPPSLSTTTSSTRARGGCLPLRGWRPYQKSGRR